MKAPLTKFRLLVCGAALQAVLMGSGTTAAFAGDDPACAGRDQGICDTLGLMLLQKGRGCHRMLSVTPTGQNGYRITCIVSSTSNRKVAYVLQFSSDQSSYTVR